MTTADELGRALDVIAGSLNEDDLPLGFQAHDDVWEWQCSPLDEHLGGDGWDEEIQAAFIGIAVPWLWERYWSLGRIGRPTWCHRNGPEDGKTVFVATVRAVLAEGARDE